MYQTWGKLLFLHWSIPVEKLRPFVPPRLEIDTWNGTAWIGITPFTMWGIRPAFLPAIPGTSSSHELNVRTYVHLNGVPGVWFFSLDANNALAVLGARLFFGLPYYDARMTLAEEGEKVRFTSRRNHSGAPPAELSAAWTRGAGLPEAKPGTLEFFLIERYALYALRRRDIWRARIHHRPWPLRRAALSSFRSTMLASPRLPEPKGEPLLHAQAEPLEVEIWSPKKV